MGGTVDLGPDNDIATLANLTPANLSGTDAVTGGLGTDPSPLPMSLATASRASRAGSP